MEIGKLREEIAKRAAAYEKTAAKADDAAKGASEPAGGDASATGTPGAGDHPAQAFYRRLEARITRVEASLKPTEGLELTHDVPDGHCYIEQLGYDQDMIVFTGHLASGRRCSVFVNVHAVNLCLTVSPLPAGETRHHIVFRGDAVPEA